MDNTIVGIQTSLMKEYYKYFSKYTKGKRPEQTVAWVTSFAPIEILEALGILYYYPESYAAVIAASNKEQKCLEECEISSISRDCCSYSCCIEGSISLGDGPRGLPPKPDVLIATNNQCNTLPGWWSMMAAKYNIPLIVLDYPGEESDYDITYDYVTEQHNNLIAKLEIICGKKLDIDLLEESISNSVESIKEWSNVISHLKNKNINVGNLFDDISFLITARCKKNTAQLYRMMSEELDTKENMNSDQLPVFWLGYPLWYHDNRYPYEALKDFKIAGANYLTWWCIDYSGDNYYEKLFNAYNYTFLNLTQKKRDKIVRKLILESGSVAAMVMKNRSCKCDFVSAKNICIPQLEIDIDMIDRFYLNENDFIRKVSVFRENICME